MLDVCLLGTGGMMPLPKRFLSSMMLRYNGSSILFDCGEATQIAIRKQGWSFKSIDLICITHFHGDHVGGLPGLLLSMGNSARTQPLTIAGPQGIEKVVGHLRVIAPELPFHIDFIELEENEQELWFESFRLEAFKLKHRTTCYGYSFFVDRAGKFDTQKASALNIPVRSWNVLQHGSNVEYEGKIYTPDMVMGPPRKGIKITYCTDSRPVPIIAEKAMNADLFICEGMYGDHEKKEDAVLKKHMTMQEAAMLACQANPKELWFTHYSPSMARPSDYIEEIREIFPRTEIPRDLKETTLFFEDQP